MKNKWLKEIDKLKNEQFNNQQLLNKLNDEIIKKNETIEKLKTNANNKNNNSNTEKEKENEQFKIELNKINEKNEFLEKEIEKYKNNIISENSNNKKIELNISETNNIIKETKESQKKIKENYENEINSLINEYEKRNNLISINNLNNLEKENNELKNINKELNKKYNNSKSLNKNYDELLKKVNQIKNENELLKNKISQKKINNSFIGYSNYKNIKVNFPTKKNNNISYNDYSYNNIFASNTTISDNNEYPTSPNLAGNVYIKNFPFDKMKKAKNERKNNSESKRPTLSSLIISDTNRKHLDFDEEGNIKSGKKEEYNEYFNETEINENFNLYKPIKEGLLVFNLAKKLYHIIVPDKYSEFWEEYISDGSLLYNTLEGLFLINSKNNQLYYYSSKKNIFCDLLTFK
jgi:hypothetical protein